MHISRIYIRNFRNFKELDVFIPNGDPLTIIGRNDTGKTNLFHAIRLVIDSKLPSWQRQLVAEDFCRSLGEKPWLKGEEIVITITFSQVEAKDEVAAFLSAIAPNTEMTTDGEKEYFDAHLSFIFAPTIVNQDSEYVLEEDYDSFLVNGKHHPSGFFYSESGQPIYYAPQTLEDLYGCKKIKEFYRLFYYSNDNKVKDQPRVGSFPKKIAGNSFGRSARRNLNVLYLDALRDVKGSFHQGYNSIISQLIRAAAKTLKSKKFDTELTDALKGLRTQNSIPDTNEILNLMEGKLGDKDASFLNDSKLIIGTPTVTEENVGRYFNFLAKHGQDFSTQETIDSLGLGSQNLAYISAVFALFNLRKGLVFHDEESEVQVVFNLLLIEEPEAHLDVQNQKRLHTQFESKTGAFSKTAIESNDQSDENLVAKEFVAYTQVIQSSHSTHLTAKTDLRSILVLQNVDGATEGVNANMILWQYETKYYHFHRIVRQYLDATRSSILFSKNVILVEGLSEKFALAAIISQMSFLKIKDIDLHGIELVEVGGRNFAPFKAFFDPQKEQHLRNKCLILDDGDITLKKGVDKSDLKGYYVSKKKKLTPLSPLGKFTNVFTFEIDTFMLPNPFDAGDENIDYLKVILVRFYFEKNYFRDEDTFLEKLKLIQITREKIIAGNIKQSDLKGFFKKILYKEVSKPTIALYLGSLLKAKANDKIELESWRPLPDDREFRKQYSIPTVQELKPFIVPRYIEEGVTWLITGKS